MTLRRAGALALSVARRAVPLLAAASLLACGPAITRRPVPDALAEKVEPFGRSGLRSWGDGLSDAALKRYIEETAPEAMGPLRAELAAGRTPELHFLALSGGGQWGAFGAGILEGWTARGDRPAFKGVSGVSTGAIIAPFAFLGPAYDATLREIYTTYATDQLLEPTIFSGLVSGASLADTRRLRGIIARYVTPELLAAIAAEHRKGRILYIGTTNLDAGRPVIWDVGAIAASGEPGALELVRELIRASSAIPVAFPPIFVEVEGPDGTVYDEMHVDGGASSQVTFVSPQVPIREVTERVLGRNLDRRLWVIVNNDLQPPHQTLTPRIPAIGAAAVSSLIRGSGIGDAYRLYAIAQRDDIDYRVTWIPPDLDCPEPEQEFDPVFMRCLFDTGRRLALEGALWRDAPPFFTRSGSTERR